LRHKYAGHFKCSANQRRGRNGNFPSHHSDIFVSYPWCTAYHMLLGRRTSAHKLQVRRASTFGVGISREGTEWSASWVLSAKRNNTTRKSLNHFLWADIHSNSLNANNLHFLRACLTVPHVTSFFARAPSSLLFCGVRNTHKFLAFCNFDLCRVDLVFRMSRASLLARLPLYCSAKCATPTNSSLFAIFSRNLANAPLPPESFRTCFVCATHAHSHFCPQHLLLCHLGLY